MTAPVTPEDFDRLMEDETNAKKISRGAVLALRQVIDDPLGIAILVCALGMLGRYVHRNPEDYAGFVMSVTVLLADAPDEMAPILDGARNKGEPKH